MGLDMITSHRLCPSPSCPLTWVSAAGLWNEADPESGSAAGFITRQDQHCLKQPPSQSKSNNLFSIFLSHLSWHFSLRLFRLRVPAYKHLGPGPPPFGLWLTGLTFFCICTRAEFWGSQSPAARQLFCQVPHCPVAPDSAV